MTFPSIVPMFRPLSPCRNRGVLVVWVAVRGHLCWNFDSFIRPPNVSGTGSTCLSTMRVCLLCGRVCAHHLGVWWGFARVVLPLPYLRRWIASSLGVFWARLAAAPLELSCADGCLSVCLCSRLWSFWGLFAFVLKAIPLMPLLLALLFPSSPHMLLWVAWLLMFSKVCLVCFPSLCHGLGIDWTSSGMGWRLPCSSPPFAFSSSAPVQFLCWNLCPPLSSSLQRLSVSLQFWFIPSAHPPSSGSWLGVSSLLGNRFLLLFFFFLCAFSRTLSPCWGSLSSIHGPSVGCLFGHCPGW